MNKEESVPTLGGKGLQGQGGEAGAKRPLLRANLRHLSEAQVKAKRLISEDH